MKALFLSMGGLFSLMVIHFYYQNKTFKSIDAALQKVSQKKMGHPLRKKYA